MTTTQEDTTMTTTAFGLTSADLADLVAIGAITPGEAQAACQGCPQATPQPMTTSMTITVEAQLAQDYLARSAQLHLPAYPGADQQALEANQECSKALDALALALANMEALGLSDGSHLVNMVGHILGWEGNIL